MECSYTLTESELVNALQLHGRGTNRTLIVLAIVGIALVLIGIFTELKTIDFGGAAGGLIGYFVTVFLIIPSNAKRQYEQNRALRGEMHISFSEQLVEFKAETGESKLKWSDIHKWKYRDGMYLLYVTSNMFYMVPSRVLENENELSNLLLKHVGPKKA
ncbi:YcxB family protein [Shewanella submarina]|uniref:YcxB family protein n=1 Tax=Shewanella submarina TaxID=2016376 RepID=A0ABV7GK88_9GAMM|nr:YcxB family protein [Shewanella submarina]MCL1036276.1 YcxB family protein [Shewanella submarina]